jgi:ABC-type multidrug transport system permease subunit
VYYPTQVIPSWLHAVSTALPLTYGLRALRRVVLEGASLRAVAPELGILLALAALLGASSAVAFARAMRDARRRGSLGQY